MWQESTQQTGFISQVSKGFPCYGDVLEFATPFYPKSSWDCSGKLQGTGPEKIQRPGNQTALQGRDRQSQGGLRCEHKWMSRDGRRLTVVWQGASATSLCADKAAWDTSCDRGEHQQQTSSEPARPSEEFSHSKDHIHCSMSGTILHCNVPGIPADGRTHSTSATNKLWNG